MPKPISIEEFVSAKSASATPTASVQQPKAQPISVSDFATAKTKEISTKTEAPRPKVVPDGFQPMALENIRNGQSGDNVQRAVGASKQLFSELSSVGAQNAGPVGAKLMADAKAKGGGAAKFAEAIEGFNKVMEPTNAAQRQGAGETALGASLVPFGAAAKAAKPLVEIANASRIARRQKDIDDAIGRVLQGEEKDIETGRKILSQVDMRDVKSYREGADRIKEKISAIARKQDEMYETNKSVRTLDNLNHTITVGGQTVKQNYVSDAISQLEDYYKKTGDVTGQIRVRKIKEKALNSGLTVKEINEIAREHGRELSGFNLNGELASGLSKQSAENTRTGVKATVRDLFGNNIAKASDAEITKLSRVGKLFDDMAEKVNDLQQRVQPRSMGERAGRLLEQALNILSAGSSRGFVQSILPRSVGYKTLNALDLEKQLQKNIKLIQKATDPATSEKDIIKSLEEFIRSAGEKPASSVSVPKRSVDGIKPPASQKLPIPK